MRRGFSETGMRLDFHIRGLKADAALKRQLESDLEGLHRLTPVNSAHVVLEHQRDTHPPFEAVLRVGVTGPDIHAAARDHTWAGAWNKALARVHDQLEARARDLKARSKRPGLEDSPQPPSKGKRAAKIL